MKKAVLHKKLENKTVQCTACSWYCKIKEGNTGICGVRQNIKGDLFLLVYGIASAVNTDPIEKKPLFHFLPGTKIFSVGTVGCNFGCGFCQNWSISQATKNLKKETNSAYLKLESSKLGYKLPPKKIIEYCIKNKINSIAFTYNEPAIFLEYAYDTMKLAKKHGIKTVLVTNGYFSKESFDMIKGLVDAVNIDLKSFNEEFYKKICQARLPPVLENIKRFHEAKVWIEITTLLIPNENDSKTELKKIASFIKSVSPSIPWHITSFHSDYKMLGKSSTAIEKLEEAYAIGKTNGLKYIYVGNVYNEEKENTYCPKCNQLLIKRSGFNIEIINFSDGVCPRCKTNIEGIWK